MVDQTFSDSFLTLQLVFKFSSNQKNVEIFKYLSEGCPVDSTRNYDVQLIFLYSRQINYLYFTAKSSQSSSFNRDAFLRQYLIFKSTG